MNRLREIRKQKELTQTELGKAVGKYQPYVHLIERHDYKTTAEQKQTLANVLGVTVEDIFCNEQ